MISQTLPTAADNPAGLPQIFRYPLLIAFMEESGQDKQRGALLSCSWGLIFDSSEENILSIHCVSVF